MRVGPLPSAAARSPLPRRHEQRRRSLATSREGNWNGRERGAKSGRVRWIHGARWSVTVFPLERECLVLQPPLSNAACDEPVGRGRRRGGGGARVPGRGPVNVTRWWHELHHIVHYAAYTSRAMLHRNHPSRVPFALSVWQIVRDYYAHHHWDLGRMFRRQSTRKRWR
jgi:hypothetical protein